MATTAPEHADDINVPFHGFSRTERVSHDCQEVIHDLCPLLDDRACRLRLLIKFHRRNSTQKRRSPHVHGKVAGTASTLMLRRAMAFPDAPPNWRHQCLVAAFSLDSKTQ